MADFKQLINKNEPVLIDFFATWCGPCKMMPPILDEVKERLGSKVSILKIDIDKNQQLARNLSIRGVPTLALYKQGKMVWRESGVRQADELERVINQYL
ncbi:MAG: thioredoxin [Bacteroidota bacterium]